MEKLLVLKWMEALKGFKAAFGPQLWSNPAVLLRYVPRLVSLIAAVYHEDIADAAVSSIAVPLPRTRRS
jgi:hypothetical protein